MIEARKTTSLPLVKKMAEPSLWQETGKEVKLGCTSCPELRLCGGLSVRAPIFNCMDLCCGKPESCARYACPHQSRYSKLVNEVGGLDLRPYNGRVAEMLSIPDYVPYIFDAGNLVGPLSLPVVALSLYQIVDHKTGLPRFASRHELLKRFRVNSDARIVITATGTDCRVERFWHVLRPKKTAEILSQLRPSVIATPNFSMHADTVRHDNLVSMARIVACFEEFAAAGLPTALHVNGRTPHDFNRWVDYLRASPAIYAVSYEMGTIGRSARRRAWHASQLARLAHSVPRPLTLLLRGGFSHIPELAGAYSRVIALDTSAHMKSKKHQRAHRLHGQLKWQSNHTPPGQSIDELVQHNVRVSGRSLLRAIRLSAKAAADHQSAGVVPGQ